MNDWIDKTVARESVADMKRIVLEAYDEGRELGLDAGETKALVRSMVPDELAFLRVLVDYWIDSERPSTT